MWVRRLLNTLRTARLQRDIERELSFHVAERADGLEAAGANRDDALRQARIRLGGHVAQIEATRDVDISRTVDALLRNVRHAGRALARTPGFTVTVVLTLALGIGANSAVFSAIDAVLLRPLPYPDSDRLVLITQAREGFGDTGVAPVRIADWNRLNTTFDGISGYFLTDAIDARGELPERFRHAMVSPGFLRVVGVAPAKGRDFVADEHRLNAPASIIVSDRLWRARGADPHVLDRPAQVEGRSVTTIGIMAAAFQLPNADIDLWSPDDADAPWQQARSLTWYTGIGRLRAGVTREQAVADLERVQARLAEQFPATDGGIGIRIEPLKETLVGGARGSLWVLFGAVSVLLLIACTNIAALLLSRAVKREHEVAIRYSLGGSRTAVVMQLLTEVGLLALLGAAAGLAVATGAAALLRWSAPDLPRVGEILVDGRILLYTAAAAVVTAVLCGVVPARRGARLMQSTRTQISPRNSTQWALVGVQVALSVTLLAGAALLLRTARTLSTVDVGFEAANTLTLHVSGGYGTDTTDQRVQRINRLLDHLDALPGIVGAAVTSTLPGVRGEQLIEFRLSEGRSGQEPLIAETRVVSPSYFSTLRIPVLAGDLCERTKDAGGGQAVVTEVMVNQRFAERYLGGRSAVGLHLAGGLDYLVTNRHLSSAPAGRITGVVGDAREHGVDREPVPTVYTCFTAADPAPWFLVRTDGDPTARATDLRRAIYDIEPRRAVYDVEPLERRMDNAYAPNRLRTSLMVLFAATALALASAGVYGTLAYVVGLRRREVALRLALGAHRGDVVRQLLTTSSRVVALAVASGLGLALLFTRSLTTMLYGVSPADPVTLAAVVLLVVVVATLAGLIPAARAALVQPMRMLREE